MCPTFFFFGEGVILSMKINSSDFFSADDSLPYTIDVNYFLFFD